jgi:hypothetical protein
MIHKARCNKLNNMHSNCDYIDYLLDQWNYNQGAKQVRPQKVANQQMPPHPTKSSL